MPELPEVEVVRRQLEPQLCGNAILKVWTHEPSYFFVTPPDRLQRSLRCKKVLRLERIGKVILICFSDGSRLLCHLGMTGQITTRPLARDRHVHLVLSLDSGQDLTFRDVRKFGKVEYIPPGQGSARLTKLGPDALEIDAVTFSARLRSRRTPIKTTLLNQAVLAGVGNIYADEALFAAGILPTTPSARLSSRRLLRLFDELRRILLASVEGGGSTINDYLKPDGQLGGYQNWHLVYGKRDQPCPNCQRPLAHQVLAGRSTHFCRHCQR